MPGMNIKVTILHLITHTHTSWTEMVVLLYLCTHPWWWPCRGQDT